MHLIRVINQQTIRRSILIDKVDRSQGNSTGYAQKAKQAVYVPFSNPRDTAVKGYLDMVPTDDVLLSADRGTIKRLSDVGKLAFAVIDTTLTATSVVTSADHAITLAATTTINGTTFLSVTPDVTYVILKNLAGATQVIPSSSFSAFGATQIQIADGTVTIGTPGAGWKVQVKANSKTSNVFTL